MSGLFALSFPLLEDAESKDPHELFRAMDEKRAKWSLGLEKSLFNVPFVYRMKDDSMAPLIQPNDILICMASRLSPRQLTGKPVLAQIKGGELAVRNFNCDDEREVCLLTALNPSLSPILLEWDALEWVHPVVGIYREIDYKSMGA